MILIESLLSQEAFYLGCAKNRNHSSRWKWYSDASQLPKQFIELKGEPILMHTIRALILQYQGHCRVTRITDLILE